jgi:hypothetical protein
VGRGAGAGLDVALDRREIPPEAEELVRRFAATAPPAEAARLLANTLSKSAAALHRVARDQAGATKGTPGWSRWAKLVNASRQLVLDAATCRDITNKEQA